MRRLFTVGSVVFHGIVIAGVFVAQLVAIGPLPVPHRALIFEGARLVKLTDIQLPPPRPVAATHTPAVSLDAAPLVAPVGIRQESGLEGIRTQPAGSGILIGVEHGIGTAIIGTVEGVPPPPPPPPPPPAPPPQQPVRLHRGIQPPQKIVDVTPIYPALARAVHVEGVVILEAVIDVRGDVQSVRVLRSFPLLDQAAIDAVRQWRYTPARLNGDVVPVIVTVTVNFSLTNR
jgi:protein TonB